MAGDGEVVAALEVSSTVSVLLKELLLVAKRLELGSMWLACAGDEVLLLAASWPWAGDALGAPDAVGLVCEGLRFVGF